MNNMQNYQNNNFQQGPNYNGPMQQPYGQPMGGNYQNPQFGQPQPQGSWQQGQQPQPQGSWQQGQQPQPQGNWQQGQMPFVYQQYQPALASQQKKKGKTGVIIGLLAGIIAVLTALLVVIFIKIGSGNSDYNSALELAQKYLNEQNYEEAKIQFLAAIDIDPKDEAAYIGLAKTYTAMADDYYSKQTISADEYAQMLSYYTEAVNVLNKSKEYLESETINVMIDNIENKSDAANQQLAEAKRLAEEAARAEEEARLAAEEAARKAAEEAEAEKTPSFEEIREEMISLYGYGYEFGQMMPDFNFYDLSGNTVYLSDFLGEPFYLNAFTTWCPYCDEEVPDMQSLYEKYDGQIEFAMVDLGETASDARGYASRFSLTIPMYTFDSWYFGDYEVTGVPTTFVLDRYGRIADMRIGMASYDWIESAIKKAISNSDY